MSNPLTSADPRSIDELIDRDPLELTEDELNENTKLLIAAFRTQREVWEREKAKAKLTGKKLSGGSVKKLQKEEVLKRIAEGPAKIDVLGDLNSMIKKASDT